MVNFDDILVKVEDYYTDKVKTFGLTPKGVDWNSEESQKLRFYELLKVIKPNDDNFSILDYGCGFGSLFEYLKERFPQFNYTGYDISKTMIEEAKNKYKNGNWINIIDQNEKFDYLIASGIFNVKLNVSEEDWRTYIINTLNSMNEKAIKGFSFNILTKYADKEFMKDNLYYADSFYFFNYCKLNYSKFVSLLHDYPLYEFTILVKKY